MKKPKKASRRVTLAEHFTRVTEDGWTEEYYMTGETPVVVFRGKESEESPSLTETLHRARKGEVSWDELEGLCRIADLTGQSIDPMVYGRPLYRPE